MTKLPEPLHFSLSGENSHPDTLELIQTLLKQSLRVRVSVSGRSMQPALNNRDVVTLHNVDRSRLRQGDLIFYIDRWRQLKLHRLIRQYQDSNGVEWLQTCGDALWCPDDAIQAKDILAVVCSVEKYRGDMPAGVINMDLLLNHLLNRLRGGMLYLRVASFTTIRKIQQLTG